MKLLMLLKLTISYKEDVMNLEIHRLKEAIVSIVNAYPLPIEVKRMVLSEVTMEASAAAKAELAEEIRKFNEQKKSEEKDGE